MTLDKHFAKKPQQFKSSIHSKQFARIILFEFDLHNLLKHLKWLDPSNNLQIMLQNHHVKKFTVNNLIDIVKGILCFRKYESVGRKSSVESSRYWSSFK